jgi:soluble lytic murein transglycosylase-like protein/uncharacterized protein YjeT (DUF2065 family)
MYMSKPQWWLRMAQATHRAAGVFLRDVGNGLLEVSHNMLALVGLAVVALLVFALGRADLRDGVERQALDWLQERQSARAEDLGQYIAEPDEAHSVLLAKALAADPAGLTRQQAAVAGWLARRYRVAPEPVARLVQEAWQVGQRASLDPTLILAIMAIESSFNPFAQSPMGAQGLMQVMTRVHNEKYEVFGGKLTAFDPVTNLRVGVQVLKECIARAGGLEAGLRYYVGSANMADDGGYAAKVLAEQRHLSRVAAGHAVPVTAPIMTAPAVATTAAPGASSPADPAPPQPATQAPEAAPATIEQVALAN